MPNLAISFAVTRVSSQKTRSAPRSTESARRLISARLPIGVATTYKPGASSVLGGAAAAGAWSGLLPCGARLGCLLPPFFFSEPALAASVAFAVRLTRRRPCRDCARLLRPADGTGADLGPATALLRLRPGSATWSTAGAPVGAACCCRGGPREGGLAGPIVGGQCRTRARDTRRRPVGTV